MAAGPRAAKGATGRSRTGAGATAVPCPSLSRCSPQLSTHHRRQKQRRRQKCPSRSCAVEPDPRRGTRCPDAGSAGSRALLLRACGQTSPGALPAPPRAAHPVRRAHPGTAWPRSHRPGCARSHGRAPAAAGTPLASLCRGGPGDRGQPAPSRRSAGPRASNAGARSFPPQG